jgi:hypothetical protein
MEGEGEQGLQSAVPNRGMQTEVGFLGLSQGRSGTCEARRGLLLASQIQSDVRREMSLGRS